MKPRIKLAEVKTPQGATLGLYEQDGAFSISCNGQELMHSKATASERLLGTMGVERLKRNDPARVLIGGLGLGFTLQSALAGVGGQAIVEVAEFVPEVVAWFRDHLGPLHGPLLEDPRVVVRVEDVTRLIRKAEPGSYDVVLLDVDNGPVPIVTEDNAALYTTYGIRNLRDALKPRGRAIFWSAGPEPKFEVRLRKEGFRVKAVPAKVHESAKRAAYTLYVADKG